jgi:hypothetical protein
MKQTAMDWLFSKLWDIERDKFEWESILKEAKEMEKEQIQDAYRFPNTLVDMSSEQYYNETFKPIK